MTIINQKSISGITSITFASAGDDLLTFHSNNGTERFRIDNSGNTKITAGIVTTLTTTGNATVGGTLNVTGETTFATHVNLGDSDKAKFGTSGDLEIYHNGTDSYVDTDVGDLRLRTTGSADDIYLTSVDDVFIQVQSSETAAKFIGNGAVELNYNDSKKFETKSDGVDITGELQCDTLDVDGDIDLDGKITFDSGGNVLDFIDNVAARFGTGNDLRVYHDGSNSRIKNTTGSLWLQSDTGIRFTDADVNESMAAFYDNGAVELYYDGSKKFETKSDGVVVTGGIYLDGSGGTGSANKLDDYEEGTWTPIDNSAGLTLSTADGRYVKIGSLVHCWGRIQYPTTSDTTATSIGGFPFTNLHVNPVNYSGNIAITDYGNANILPMVENNQIQFRNYGNGTLTNANMSGKFVYLEFRLRT